MEKKEPLHWRHAEEILQTGIPFDNRNKILVKLKLGSALTGKLAHAKDGVEGFVEFGPNLSAIFNVEEVEAANERGPASFSQADAKFFLETGKTPSEKDKKFGIFLTSTNDGFGVTQSDTPFIKVKKEDYLKRLGFPEDADIVDGPGYERRGVAGMVDDFEATPARVNEEKVSYNKYPQYVVLEKGRLEQIAGISTGTTTVTDVGREKQNIQGPSDIEI